MTAKHERAMRARAMTERLVNDAPTTADGVGDGGGDGAAFNSPLTRRRARFLAGGSVIVSGAFTLVHEAVYLQWADGGMSAAPRIIILLVVLVVLSIPVVFVTLAALHTRPRLTWGRAVGGVAIANGVLLPFGYVVVATFAFDALRGAIWLGALVAGSLIVHTAALMAEELRRGADSHD